MRPAGGAAPSDVVLEVERTIGPDASRTHIPFAFDLGPAAVGLEISFSYDPKVLDDEGRAKELIEAARRAYGESGDLDPAAMALKNLLTLSLDGPSGFRGCAHRHPPRQLVTIGRTTATPGFIPGALEPGRWTATISVHLVVTDRCTFALRVRAL